MSCSGISLLAAEGNKNSEGHIIYEVAKDYLEAFGSKATINACTQWTKQGDVVKWLDSLVRSDDSPPNKLDDGLSMDVEEDVLPHAEVSHLATRYVVLALPAPSQAHLYENRTRRGRKRKCVDLVPKHQGDGSSIDEKEKLAQEDSVKEFPRKLRSSLLHQKQDSGRLDATNLLPPKAAAASEPTTVKFKIDLPSIEPTGIQALEPKPHHPASFQVGEKIEILCQDSGMRGCWFVCKILKVSENSFKVQYNDMDNVEESGKLEEWVRSSRLADPGKLSLRHSGRPIIRPCPPEEPSRQFFEVGAAVEAWWNNGWWESFVLTGVSLSSNNNSYHVFLPGECKFLNLYCKHLRVARDWINNTWVAVEPQPDILSVIRPCLEQRADVSKFLM